MKVLRLFFIILILILSLIFSPTVAFAASARLFLSPATGNFTVDQVFEIKIELDTGGGRTSGTDVRLLYEPDKLEIVRIAPGKIYPQYLGIGIDLNNKTAQISGISSNVANLFSGRGIFATIQARGVSPGTTFMTFDFKPGERNDSNVADFDTVGDILAAVDNGSYTIVTPTPSPQFTATPTPKLRVSPEPTRTPTPTPIGRAQQPTVTPSELPEAGDFKMTTSILGVGLALTLLGIGAKLLLSP